NHVGLPLKAIGEILGCHYATVTNRMKAMRITPVYTRHSFMEDIFKALSPDQQDWLSNYLYNNQISIKSFLSFLIQQAYAGAIECQVCAQLRLDTVENEDLQTMQPEYDHIENDNHFDQNLDLHSPLCSYSREYPKSDGQVICPIFLDAQEGSSAVGA